MNMMNKCAKFHKDSVSGKKVKFNLPSAIELRRRPILCTTLHRNLKQNSNFGGTFDQLFLWIFLWKFHRRCLSTSSIQCLQKVKNDQKLKSRVSCRVYQHVNWEEIESPPNKQCSILSGRHWGEPSQSQRKDLWHLFIIISRESKWGTLKSAGNPRCAVPAEIHSICTDRRDLGPAAGLQVSPTSDTCQ